jgi:EAL domain-containing protein (putative c-di-GMP-specific phosphodiesterase class I)
MSVAAATEQGILRRYASDQLVTLAKVVVESAFQPIVEAGTGAIFGYDSLMRGQERPGFESPIEILDEAERSRNS